jgi:hypothetical protein
MSAISDSDIDICYSDIGRNYVGLKIVIPISTYESIPISDIQKMVVTFAGFEPNTFLFMGELLTSEPLF